MSDDDAPDPRAVRDAKSSMRSLFESDRRSAREGSQTLRYERSSAGAGGDPAVAAAPGGSTAAASAAAGTVAKQARVVAYRGDAHVGRCAAVLLAQPTPSGGPAGAWVVLVGSDRRPQCRVRIDDSLQFLQNASDAQYATVYDPSAQLHWTLQFESATDATHFAAAVATLQYYALLPDGPRPAYTALSDESGLPPAASTAARRGDSAVVAMTTWLLQRVGATALHAPGRLVEEIAIEAPRRVRVGDGSLMAGVDDALRAMPPGARRVVVLPPRKTRASGLGAAVADVGPSDTVVVFVQVFSVDRALGVPRWSATTIRRRRRRCRRRRHRRRRRRCRGLAAGTTRARATAALQPRPPRRLRLRRRQHPPPHR